MDVRHKFQSAVPDPGTPGVVQPSDWNDEHDFELAGRGLVGRSAAGPGPAVLVTAAEARELLGVDGSLNYRRDDLTALAGNNMITLNQTPHQSALDIYRNSTLMRLSAYTRAGNVVTLDPPAAAGDVYSVNYWSAALAGSTALSTLNFNIATLFAAGQQGLWYGAWDVSTLLQDSAGTLPVTAAGQAVGRVNDKSGRGNNAAQATAPARPLYQTGPARLVFDRVDDLLTVTVPAGGWVGTMVLGTTIGTAAYGVNIPAGTYTIGPKNGARFPGTAIVGQVIRNGALTPAQITSVVDEMVTNGATAGYGAVTDFTIFWRTWSELTSFPLIDTSAGTNFNEAWFNCTSLTSFPLINTSAGTIFRAAWFNCTSLTSFPLINTSAGTSFGFAWYGCSGLTSFSLINTSAGTNFGFAWLNCTSLTSFPLIDTSAGTNFNSAWFGCISLTSFPLINTSAGTNFGSAWQGCSGLTSFPPNAFDAVKGGDFTGAFTGTALTQASIDGILTSLVTSGIATGTRVFNQSGGSAPSVATGQPAITTLRSRGWTVTVTGGF